MTSWGYYTLIDEGIDKDEALRYLKGKKEWEIHEMLFERGINLATLPAWQRSGIIVSTKEYEISGFNPLIGKEAKSLRRKVTQNWEIPKFKSEEGIVLLEKLINRN